MGVDKQPMAPARSVVDFGSAPAFGATQANLYGRPIYIMYRVAIIAEANRNGHIYFEINSGNPNTWLPIDYLACRSEASNTDGVGVGRGLGGFVPAGYFFRWRTQIITSGGFDPSGPTFLTDGANPSVFVL